MVRNQFSVFSLTPLRSDVEQALLLQGHTTKSPYIPLYKRGRLEKGFPLWKRGTKGDSSFYKKERLEKDFPLWKRGIKGDSSLYKKERLEKGFPLWKRGTKGDSSFYKKERLEKDFPPL